MIVEKLTDEDFNKFLSGKVFKSVLGGFYGINLNTNCARNIRRENGRVVFEFNYYGEFFFTDFDFYTCYFDEDYYVKVPHRLMHGEHDSKWCEFMSNHPEYGEEWKKLFQEKLREEKERNIEPVNN